MTVLCSTTVLGNYHFFINIIFSARKLLYITISLLWDFILRVVYSITKSIITIQWCSILRTKIKVILSHITRKLLRSISTLLMEANRSILEYFTYNLEPFLMQWFIRIKVYASFHLNNRWRDKQIVLFTNIQFL